MSTRALAILVSFVGFLMLANAAALMLGAAPAACIGVSGFVLLIFGATGIDVDRRS